MGSKRTKFRLKPGQIDYSHIRWAPVINCIIRYKGRILLVQRRKELHYYPGYWNGISGFLDDHRSLRQKVTDEIREELGIPRQKIKKITLGPIFDLEAPKYKKTWIIHPVLADVATDKIKLDWESSNYQWTTFQNAKKLKLLPGFDEVLKRVSSFTK